MSSKATKPGVVHRSTSPKNSAWSVTAAKSSGRSIWALRVCASVSSASVTAARPRTKS